MEGMEGMEPKKKTRRRFYRVAGYRHQRSLPPPRAPSPEQQLFSLQRPGRRFDGPQRFGYGAKFHKRGPQPSPLEGLPALPDSPVDGFGYDIDPSAMRGLADDSVEVGVNPISSSRPRLQNLSRWQDKQSNDFSYFCVRGGLPNFQLLDLPTGPSDVKFHVTQYMHFVDGESTPQNPSNYILPFGYGNSNSINPYASSAQFLSGMAAGTETIVRIQYGCLNAISRSVKEWPTLVPRPIFGSFRGCPCTRDTNTGGGPFPNIDCLPDPEHCFLPGNAAYFSALLNWVSMPNAIYTWPYDELYHRDSSSVSLYNLRISGTVRAQEYRRQILCEAPLINGVYWSNLVRYCRPIIYVVVYVDRTGTVEGDTDFDDAVDATGQDVSTAQTPMGGGIGDGHDANLLTYGAVVPRVYAEIPSHCEVLAFECIDMSKNEDSYNTPRYLTYAPGYTVNETGVPLGNVVPADATATYSAVDMPFEEHPFVFDIDLNGLVVNFRKDNFNYLRPSTYPLESIGRSMLVNNTIHIAAYCHYAGFPVTRSFDTTAPTAERMSYCQPISIGYASFLTFKDFVTD